MRRNLLLALACSLAVATVAQPTWRFHLAFEDGTGARDTLWFIWDTTATIYFSEVDVDYQLGEGPVNMDPTAFNMWMYNGVGMQRTQTDAQPYGPNGSYPWFFGNEIYGENITSPLIMRWDTSLFNAPFLPEPVRYAAMNGEYFYWHPDGYIPPVPEGYIIPDQVWLLMGRDSLVFQDVEFDPPFPIYLILGNWENHLSVQESPSGKIRLTLDGRHLMVESVSGIGISDILITDAIGRSFLHERYNSQSQIMVELPDFLPVGLYMVMASIDTGPKIVGKFIKP